jgi:hypothetical protein
MLHQWLTCEIGFDAIEASEKANGGPKAKFRRPLAHRDFNTSTPIPFTPLLTGMSP